MFRFWKDRTSFLNFRSKKLVDFLDDMASFQLEGWIWFWIQTRVNSNADLEWNEIDKINQGKPNFGTLMSFGQLSIGHLSIGQLSTDQVQSI